MTRIEEERTTTTTTTTEEEVEPVRPPVETVITNAQGDTVSVKEPAPTSDATTETQTEMTHTEVHQER